MAGVALAVVGAVYAAVAVLAWLAADHLIFQPPPASYAASDARFRRDAGADAIVLAYLPGDTGGLTILYSHGNAEDLGDVFPALQELHALGFGVIAYDYRGYGRSGGGPPGARKAGEDAEAAYRYAVDGLGLRPERLVLYGRSVGSGPTLELAVRHRPAGLVLESAFTSAFRVVTGVKLLPFDRFPNLERLRRVRCPVLLIHGTEDRVVPFAHGRRLWAAAPEPKRALWVQGAGHNDVARVAGPAYARALLELAGLIREAGETSAR